MEQPVTKQSEAKGENTRPVFGIIADAYPILRGRVIPSLLPNDDGGREPHGVDGGDAQDSPPEGLPRYDNL